MLVCKLSRSILLTISLFLLFPAVQAALPIDNKRELPSLATMLKGVVPTVVNIATEGHIRQNLNPLFADPFFRRFFNLPDQQIERKTNSLGSGVIVDAKRGLILTNNHVIANADQITVTLQDGRILAAEIVGADPETDVAVIKVTADKLTAIRISDSEKIRVGDFVVAIGNPFGLGQTVTSGIVSALDRSGLGIHRYEDFIQTDASINPGNSGGALVNLRGELVGINTAIFSQTGGNIGIGFVIPINLAMRIMEQLLETGKVTRAFLGVSMQNINPELADAFQLKNRTGAIINDVFDGSPASRAGLKAGDIVLSVNGKKIRNADDLRNMIGLLPIGKTIDMQILRGGREEKVTVKITESQVNGSMPRVVNKMLEGVMVTDINKGSPYYGSVQGVQVLKLARDSVAWRNGLRVGDIITSVNKKAVANVREFLAAIDKAEKRLLLRIIRGNTAAFLVLKP